MNKHTKLLLSPLLYIFTFVLVVYLGVNLTMTKGTYSATGYYCPSGYELHTIGVQNKCCPNGYSYFSNGKCFKFLDYRDFTTIQDGSCYASDDAIIGDCYKNSIDATCDGIIDANFNCVAAGTTGGACYLANHRYTWSTTTVSGGIIVNKTEAECKGCESQYYWDAFSSSCVYNSNTQGSGCYVRNNEYVWWDDSPVGDGWTKVNGITDSATCYAQSQFGDGCAEGYYKDEDGNCVELNPVGGRYQVCLGTADGTYDATCHYKCYIDASGKVDPTCVNQMYATCGLWSPMPWDGVDIHIRPSNQTPTLNQTDFSALRFSANAYYYCVAGSSIHGNPTPTPDIPTPIPSTPVPNTPTPIITSTPIPNTPTPKPATPTPTPKPQISCFRCDVNGSYMYQETTSSDEAARITGGKDCESVDSAKCNTPINPPTGNVAIIVVWIIGIMTIGYAFWYFKKVNSLESK